MNPPPSREVAVFSAARRLPAAERAAYLDEVCAGDAILRRRLEELLQADEQALGFLQNPAPDAQPRVDASASPRTLEISAVPGEMVGDRIGRYKLLQQIGEGGCGVVYMAQQEQPVRRRVALKVIKLGMDTKQVIARFEAERQALGFETGNHGLGVHAQLDHLQCDPARPDVPRSLISASPRPPPTSSLPTRP